MTLKFRVGLTAATMCLAGAGLLAQTATSTTALPQNESKAPDKITITGCVERADRKAADPTLGTTLDSLSFVLISIPAPTDSGGKPGGSASTAKGYRLDGMIDMLNLHVGHEVEIRGSVDEPARSNDVATPVNGPKVKVESIRMLAETCAR
jgi:hypothetical protein